MGGKKGLGGWQKETKRLVTWSRSLLLQCRQTMLFCEGILPEPFETGVYSRELGREGENMCVMRLLFQIRNSKPGRDGNIMDLTIIISQLFPSSQNNTSQPTAWLAQPVFIASVWVYGYSVSTGDRVQARLRRLIRQHAGYRATRITT